MAITNDRVGELLEGARPNRRVLISPEGVPLDILIAGRGERLAALLLDLLIQIGAIAILYLAARILVFPGAVAVARTILLFAAFMVRNFYFIHFELAWQGRTPGKAVCGLRVINREGGELTPGAVIARNFSREAELFLPLSVFLSLDAGAGGLGQLALLGWTAALASVPFWNRERLRAGDIIGGTQVIVMPRRVLLGDLVQAPSPVRRDGRREEQFAFSHEQLSIYGALELQVLEEFLRRPRTFETDQLLREVCGKIMRKIGWSGEVADQDVRRFLTDFYAAERAELERGKLYGKFREDKNSPSA